MNCLAWNCQGLGQHLAVQSLCSLVKATKPQLVFLSETKATQQYMNSIRIKLGFKGGLHVNRVGYGGGLSLLWSDSMDVSILNYSSGHIDAMIKDHLGLTWRFTGFYGHPKKEERHNSWTLLRRLSTINSLPWICTGDFNEVMFQWEKDGARPASLSQMEAFKHAVDDSLLKDLGASNGIYTWFGKRYSTNVRERLDRALVNEAWQTLFPHSQVALHATSQSDHLPLIITFDRSLRSTSSECSFIYRFETYWAQDEECHEVINYHWQTKSSTNPLHMLDATQKTRKGLKVWSANKFGSLPKAIANMRVELQTSIQQPNTDCGAISRKQAQLQVLEAKEETYWRQRSLAEWLQFGDRNTKYFHHKANSRRHSNRINSITDDQGIQHDSLDDVAGVFNSYFTRLFTASSSDLSILSNLEFAHLSASSRQFLELEYTLDEVCKAVKDLPATKAPGSDGMQLIFVKHYWDILGSDIATLVLQFLNGGGDISILNHTLMCRYKILVLLCSLVMNSPTPKEHI